MYDFVERGVILTYPKGGETLVPNTTERIRWDANGTFSNFDLAYSADSGLTWNPITTGINASLRYYDWTVPNINSGKVKIKVTKGAATSISDTTFSIYNVPQNLRVDTACATTFTLSWDSVANATSYNVYMLGTKYMDIVGTTTQKFYKFTGVNVVDTYYVSVSAHDSITGATSQRAYTFIKLPGYKHCSDTVDLTITKISSPYTDTMFNCALPNTTPITINIKNIYATGVCMNPIAYLQINNGAINAESVTASINPGDSVNYTFITNPYLSTPGVYTIKTWVKGDNDINANNDTTIKVITILASTVYNQPFQQTFDTTIFTPDNWQVKDYISGTHYWLPATVIGKSGTSTKAAEMKYYFYALPNTDILQTPIVFVTPNISTAFINFDVAYAPASTATNNDALQLWISTDCGTTFLPMAYNKAGAALQTVSTNIPNFVPTQGDQWRTESVSLASYINQKVIIQFRAMNNEHNNLFIDNVNIQASTNPLNITEEKNSVLKMYPNPTQENTTLELYTYSAQDLKININNTLGQTISTQKVKTVTGFNSFLLDTKNLASGIYIVEMQNNKWQKEIKLIKK